MDAGGANERQIDLELIAYSKPADLAFLKPRNKGVRLPKGLSLAVKERDITETMPIWIIGFPFGDGLGNKNVKLSPTIGSGTVSKIGRDTKDPDFIQEIQINGDLNPGNSGGPIINKRGRVVAVAKQTILGAHIGFAIPPSIVQYALDGVATGSSVTILRTQGKNLLAESYLANVRSIGSGDFVRRGVFLENCQKKRPQRTYEHMTLDAHGAPSDGPISWVTLEEDPANNGTYTGTISRISYPTDNQWGFF